jgi:hypothetical protein
MEPSISLRGLTYLESAIFQNMEAPPNTGTNLHNWILRFKSKNNNSNLQQKKNEFFNLGIIICVSRFYKLGRSQKCSQRGQKGSIPSGLKIILLLNHARRKFGRHDKLGSDGWKCWFTFSSFRSSMYHHS